MKIHNLKIFYYIVFTIYLGSINVNPFFHHHEEEHFDSSSSNTLHTHSFDISQKNNEAIQSEIHSADNNYFDGDHTNTISNILFSTNCIILSDENVGAKKFESFSFITVPFKRNFINARDKYVLSEANLPPPLS